MAMQSPPDELGAACPRVDGAAASFRAQYGPLALLVILFASLDVFVPFMAKHIFGAESEYTSGLAIEDGSGVTFFLALPTPGSEGYLAAALIATVMAMYGQQASLALWAVFSAGHWPIRFVLMMGAVAGCHGLVGAQLLQGNDNETGIAGKLAIMPLSFLAAAAPFIVWRIWTGRKLSHSDAIGPRDSTLGITSRRFAIRDVLALTAFVAVQLALVRWTGLPQQADIERIAIIAVFSLSTILYSALYILPLASGLLSRSRRAFIYSLAYAAFCVIVSTLFSISLNMSALQLGAMVGLILGLLVTAPISLLIWRWCGWRLT